MKLKNNQRNIVLAAIDLLLIVVTVTSIYIMLDSTLEEQYEGISDLRTLIPVEIVDDPNSKSFDTSYTVLFVEEDKVFRQDWILGKEKFNRTYHDVAGIQSFFAKESSLLKNRLLVIFEMERNDLMIMEILRIANQLELNISLEFSNASNEK